jgi:hypothetical protein
MHHEAASLAARFGKRRPDKVATTRSKLTNGRKLLFGIDGRSAVARRYRDIVRDLTTEAGGASGLAESSTVRQCAAIMLRAELLQSAIVAGEDVDNDILIRLSSEVRRLMASLRKQSQPRAHIPLRERLAAEAAEVT